MIEEGKFGVQEAVSLLTITIVSKAFYTSPAMVMKVVGTAGWYMTMISALTATIAFTPVYLLLKRFPGKNIMEAYDTVLGRVGGSVFSFLFFFIILVSAAANIREFTEVLIVYVYPLSPPSYIMILLSAIIAFAAFLGLESIARVSRLFAGILLSGLALLMVLSVKNYKFYRLFPILGYGFGKTLINGLLRSSAYGDIIIIAVFACSLQGISHVRKAGYNSLVFAGIIITSIIFTFTLSFPYYTGKEATAPMYLSATLIDFGPFFKRLESMFLFIWSISHVISSSALFYISLMIYSHIFNIEDKKPLILPLSIILFALAMIPDSMNSLITIYMQTLRSYGWVIFFPPPALVLLLAVIKGRKGESKSAKSC